MAAACGGALVALARAGAAAFFFAGTDFFSGLAAAGIAATLASALAGDFLATLANDQSYTSAGKPSGVYQAGQTPGKYYNVTYSGLGAALSDIAGQILRLSAH